MIRQHPVQQHGVSDRAADVAESRPHRRHDNSRLLGKELAQLGHRSLNSPCRRPQLTRTYTDPEPCGIKAEAVDFARDLRRLVTVERKRADAELEPGSPGCEVRELSQTGSVWLVVRPQRVESELLGYLS